MAKAPNFLSAAPVAALLLLAAIGCDSGPRFVTVAGVVTLDGVPLSDAAIAFEPMQPGPIAAANTDAQGRFAVVTSNRQGLIPGQYRVSVTKYELLGFDINKPGDFSTVTVKWITPERYSKTETSGLVYEITDSMPELAIALTK